ncbi:conserved hypothetical protein [Coccidioides posadasii str. Silveira]|uniref:Uncharacterized protein n=3 Tax=Coccidioides posadasii TaxID=199306 RepID=E9D892_COCPS|nr:conserved hypothetical protein [Coccidioides posadasii str. Silveira]
MAVIFRTQPLSYISACFKTFFATTPTFHRLLKEDKFKPLCQPYLLQHFHSHLRPCSMSHRSSSRGRPPSQGSFRSRSPLSYLSGSDSAGQSLPLQVLSAHNQHEVPPGPFQPRGPSSLASGGAPPSITLPSAAQPLPMPPATAAPGSFVSRAPPSYVTNPAGPASVHAGSQVHSIPPQSRVGSRRGSTALGSRRSTGRGAGGPALNDPLNDLDTVRGPTGVSNPAPSVGHGQVFGGSAVHSHWVGHGPHFGEGRGGALGGVPHHRNRGDEAAQNWDESKKCMKLSAWCFLAALILSAIVIGAIEGSKKG